MDNNEANSPLGLVSRGLAFALKDLINPPEPGYGDVITNLQEALYEYGVEIARKTRTMIVI